jgi:hypothetical protein
MKTCTIHYYRVAAFYLFEQLKLKPSFKTKSGHTTLITFRRRLSCLFFAVYHGDCHIYSMELMSPFGVFNLYPAQSPSVFTLKMLVYAAFIPVYPFFIGDFDNFFQKRFQFFLLLFGIGKRFFTGNAQFFKRLCTACGQTVNFSANFLRNCTVPQIPVGMLLKQTGRFIHVLKRMPRVFIFNYTLSEYYAVCRRS